jgi:hypothetical protein
MDALANELHRTYALEVYPVLALNDPVYQRCLKDAGVGWTGQHSVPLEKREAFEEQMRLQASFAAQKIRSARSLDPATIRVKVLSGPFTLYRVADSASKDTYGIWWFTEKVARRCREEAGPNPQARLDWLRNVLAVCYNWSRFDLIQRLAIHSGERIPAILGKGLPMPHYKLIPFFDRKTGQQVVPNPPADYWQKKGAMLFGGELQIVLPWIPVHRIAKTAWL